MKNREDFEGLYKNWEKTRKKGKVGGLGKEKKWKKKRLRVLKGEYYFKIVFLFMNIYFGMQDNNRNTEAGYILKPTIPTDT